MEEVLSIGSTRYVTFRKVVYAIPPISFDAGCRATELHVTIVTLLEAIRQTGRPDDQKAYYRALRRMAVHLWKHIRPVKSWKKFAWSWRLLSNPFLRASEQEILDLTNFFLQCRMKSSVQSLSEIEALQK